MPKKTKTPRVTVHSTQAKLHNRITSRVIMPLAAHHLRVRPQRISNTKMNHHGAAYEPKTSRRTLKKSIMMSTTLPKPTLVLLWPRLVS
jgi:hypothetical protein